MIVKGLLRARGLHHDVKGMGRQCLERPGALRGVRVDGLRGAELLRQRQAHRVDLDGYDLGRRRVHQSLHQQQPHKAGADDRYAVPRGYPAPLDAVHGARYGLGLPVLKVGHIGLQFGDGRGRQISIMPPERRIISHGGDQVAFCEPLDPRAHLADDARALVAVQEGICGARGQNTFVQRLVPGADGRCLELDLDLVLVRIAHLQLAQLDLVRCDVIDALSLHGSLPIDVVFLAND